jgi:hypothetical protein
MNHEDNERHFKAWLDKNSWRRDIQRLEKEYGTGPKHTDEFAPLEAPDIVGFLHRILDPLKPTVCATCGAPCRETPKCTVCEALEASP